jgi:hypothetical protein
MMNLCTSGTPSNTEKKLLFKDINVLLGSRENEQREIKSRKLMHVFGHSKRLISIVNFKLDGLNYSYS